MTHQAQHKIIIIRRDNIGDMVCTTPLIKRVKQLYPSSQLLVFCNSYNAPIIKNNPDIDQVYFYTKTKHVGGKWRQLRAVLGTAATMFKLRLQHIDVALIASPGGIKYAKLMGAKKIVCKPDSGGRTTHEVESALSLVGLLPDETQDKLLIVPDQAAIERFYRVNPLPTPTTKRIGIHISARRVLQQWPVEHFAALIDQLAEQQFQILLFGSPGSADNLQHPGDDDKIAAILQQLSPAAASAVHPIKTLQLEELVAGLAVCDAVICPDGGAMHIAAGLGKPIVALFGEVDPENWRPWGVPHRVLKAQQTDCVAEIAPQQVAEALSDLLQSL
jgi:ADP-heptose:LPS heptosyltransferase